MKNTRDFVLEIGCEELPSAPLNKAMVQLHKLFSDELKASGLASGAVQVASTPRRLTVLVEDVAEATEEIHQVMRGPATQLAFDEEGNPTKAASGFARGKGVAVEDLIVREDKDGREYVFCEKHIPSVSAVEILKSISETVIPKISWPRSQRWGTTQQRFVRPVRWLVCLFGDQVIPVEFAGVTSSNVTYGHRVLAPGQHVIAEAKDYERVLLDAYVMLDEKRRETILEQVAQIESERPGYRVDMPKRTFDEVVNLCEWPSSLVGTFDEEFLEVPSEIIVESMLVNQRYFPIYDAAGDLTRQFVVVANSDPRCAATVIDGNERVVRARLSDAKFFYEEDLQVSLDAFAERLASVVFQEKLGTVADKTGRIEALSALIAAEAGMDAEQVALSRRAAHICKADLVSQAVVEFTSQQGVMGGYYALAQGEDPQVADAIREHYHPRFAGDILPTGQVGCVVATADKMDTIAGIFAIGEPPTGSSDPFAVRRATIGVIQLLQTMPEVNLADVVEGALKLYEADGLQFDFAKTKDDILNFFLGRLASIAREQGVSADTIEAVSATGVTSPTEYLRRAHALEKARKEDPETFQDLATAYARASHLSQSQLGHEIDRDLMDAAELNLAAAIDEESRVVDESLAAGNYEAALQALAALRMPIDAFFDQVLVMDEDEKIRNNRIKLLNRFTAIFEDVANIGALAKKK